MRALIIQDGNISEIEHEGTAEALCKILNCRFLKSAGRPDDFHEAVIDDEVLRLESGGIGWLPGMQYMKTTWSMKNIPGTVIIVGREADTGLLDSATLSCKELEGMIKQLGFAG